MYSYDERVKAVNLYIKYDLSAADTVRELGYPGRKMLKLWYNEYQATGELHRKFIKHPNFGCDQINKAVNYNLEHPPKQSREVLQQFRL